MQKKGFTIAELLITIGIIGVIAAIGLPAINSVKPDKNKMEYLKTRDTVSNLVKNLAADSNLYPACQQAQEASCHEYPLMNTEQPRGGQYNNARYTGDTKLCSLIGLHLGVAEGDLSCSDDVYAFNANDYTGGFADASFTTKDGKRWRISPSLSTLVDNNFWGRFQTDIYVDIDPTNNSGTDRSCIYNADNCTEPDIFKFMVAADGKVVPADPKGRLYIENRKSYIRKNENVQDGEVIANNLPENRFFGYRRCTGEEGSPCAENEDAEITNDGVICTPREGGGGG